jgi:hypothetical protein
MTLNYLSQHYSLFFFFCLFTQANTSELNIYSSPSPLSLSLSLEPSPGFGGGGGGGGGLVRCENHSCCIVVSLKPIFD